MRAAVRVRVSSAASRQDAPGIHVTHCTMGLHHFRLPMRTFQPPMPDRRPMRLALALTVATFVAKLLRAVAPSSPAATETPA